MKNTVTIIAFTIAVALPIALGACAPTKTSESTGQYVDDAAITSKVKTAIVGDSTLKVMEINVTTYRTAVQLSGFVDTPQMIAHASDVARQVSGVSSVQNDLIVK